MAENWRRFPPTKRSTVEPKSQLPAFVVPVLILTEGKEGKVRVLRRDGSAREPMAALMIRERNCHILNSTNSDNGERMISS
jgi:hypothetical protein